MSFKPYPKYKESGVAWLGRVPEHWVVCPVKSISTVVNGYPFDSKLFDPSAGHPLIRIRDLNKSSTEAFYTGAFVDSAAVTSEDVLIGMDGDFNVGRWKGEGKALLNQRMCCLRGQSTLHTRLLEYALPIPLTAINAITYSTTVKHLSSSEVEHTRVAIPADEAEMEQVAAFLDHETAKIDALIAEQQRLIELLQEKRQAVISHAVTKGLNPDAPMKDSGIEWLGKVPEHWEVATLRRLDCLVQTGPFGSQLHAEEYVSGGTPVVNPTHMIGGQIVPSEDITVTDDVLARLPHQRLCKGDVVFSRRGELGRCALVTEVEEGWLCGTGSMILRLNGDEYASDYLSLFLSLDVLRQYFESFSVGTVMDSLSAGTLLSLPVVVPPLAEQRECVVFARSQALQLDELRQQADSAVALLQERRSALISAAVTGQFDVRDFAGSEAA